MRSASLLTAGFAGLALSWSALAARAQDADPRRLPYDDTGSLVVLENNYVKIRDSKNELWVLEINPKTKVMLTGSADRDFLRSSSLYVQFTGEIDAKGNLKNEADEIQIFSPEGKSSLGVFSVGEAGAPPKPVRGNTAGKFLIKGRLASYKDGQIKVTAGSRKITGQVADDVAVTLNLDDASLAQSGDSVKAKASYYDETRATPNRPGTALAEEITITLAKPLTYTGKRSRAPEKATKPASKSGRVNK